MTQLSNTATARWFDPTSGTYATIPGSPFANTGTQEFTPPGSNAAGDPDWVLTLEAPLAPQAQSVVLQRSQSSGAKVSVAGLLANDTDPFNKVLTLVSAGPTSTNGGAVAVSDNWVFYTPLPGFTNCDAFPYTIANGEGLQASGTVLVTVPANLCQSQNIAATNILGNGNILIQYRGIPGYTYTIQYTEDLGSLLWMTLGTSTADATGSFAFTDTPPPDAPPRFYRSAYP
jgi:hypothetical protein